MKPSRLTAFVLIIFGILAGCAPHPENPIILCAGDSLTESVYPRDLRRLLEAAGIRARVVNFGRSGHTSGEYLDYLRHRRKEMAAENPDLILIQLGTNDVRSDHDRTPVNVFADNMTEIIRIFQQFKTRNGKIPRICLATIPPVPAGTPFPFTAESVRRVIEEINPAVSAIAGREKLPLADHYRLFMDRPELLEGVHPTREGYRLMAENWLRIILPWLDFS